MIKRIINFMRDELRHVYLRKLEQRKSELEYEISSLEQISDKGDIFFIKLNDMKISHSKIVHLLSAKKEEWKIE